MKTFVFAAARDGDCLLSCVEAPTIIEAREMALKEAARHHGLEIDEGDEREEGEIESQLDGFEIDHIANFLYSRRRCPTCNCDELGVPL